MGLGPLRVVLRTVEGALSLPCLVKPKESFVRMKLDEACAARPFDMPFTASNTLQCTEYILPSALWNLRVRTKYRLEFEKRADDERQGR